MGFLSTKKNHGGRSVKSRLPDLSALASVSRRTDIAEEKSTLILRVLRQKAQRSRNKKPQPFFSIRAVASHFAVPPTTVSRIYSRLKDEGLLASIWGSKTVVEPVKIDNQLRVRAVVALPASLTCFCTVREYRRFFLEMRNALWKLGFATRLLFYEGRDADEPTFAELLLNYKVGIVIWFLPTPRMKGTAARLVDRGIRAITVTDFPASSAEHPYYISRERALKDGLLAWQRDGITSITVLQSPHYESGTTVATIEKCLREATLPYTVVKAESWQSHDSLRTRSQRKNRAIVFPSSELAVRLGSQHAGQLAELLEQSRVMMVNGLIDLPGWYPVNASIDVIEVDWEIVAKRIASDLAKSTRSPINTPIVFQAKWVQGASKNRAAMRYSDQ
jgi:hypothetical protein